MAMKTVSASGNDGIPQWKKDLIARLKNQNKNVEERLWIDHHSPNHHSLQAHHHVKGNLTYPFSSDNGFSKDHQESPDSSDSEDLHYGPGIVNRLRNKYLSLALRESNVRPTILRKATSLENLLDEDEGEENEKEDGRLFRRRGGGNDGGSHQHRFRSSTRRQEIKRARSVEAISRTNHDEEVTMTSSVTAKINNRQSLHEEMLVSNNIEKTGSLIENTKLYKKNSSIENGTDDTSHKYNGKINRPKRIPPLLNEREKPPVDVVKQTKLIFERRSDQRSKKHPPTGDVAAKVDSFNNIIVKAKTASKATKLPTKHTKPVLNDKTNSNTQHHARPVAKPIILSEEMVKPKTLDLKKGRKEPITLTSPIPDVSRVDNGNENRNSLNSLCETPDLILTSSPIPKITSPTYRIRSTENFINEERNHSFLSPTETTNKFISPILSPTKLYSKPTTLNFNKEEVDLPGIKMISPISQKNINKQSATSVFNFINSHVDQKHLPVANKNVSEHKIPPSEPLKIEVNGVNGTSKKKAGLSAFEIEKNHKNAVKSGLESEAKAEEVNKVKSPTVAEVEFEQNAVSSGVFSGKPTKDGDSDVDIAGTDGDGVVNQKKPDFLGENHDSPEKSWQVLGKTGNTVEKISDIFENLGKNNKTSIEPTVKLNKSDSVVEECVNVPSQNLIEITVVHAKPHSKTVAKVDEKPAKPAVKTINKIETVDRTSLKPVQSKSASEKSGSEENAKIIFPKKPKARVEETTTAVFNFTTRRDVPDYIANDTSRVASRPVIPKPDEPGIKLLPEALRVNFKEIQEALDEQELIRSLEARPPSPCNVTFINDNVLIDGKSSLLQQTSRRVKLKISFVDDAEIYEYPSETSLLLEDSPLPTPLGGSTVGQTVPALSGSLLATYIPKNIEDFELGITKTFYEQPVPSSKPDVAEVPEPPSDIILEEIDKPVLFSTGGTSDMLF